MSIKSGMSSNHLILCCPLFLLPSLFSRIRVFSNELALCIRWPKYWSFSISSPNNRILEGWFQYLGSISFRIDWFDVLAIQGAREERLGERYTRTLCTIFATFLQVHNYSKSANMCSCICCSLLFALIYTCSWTYTDICEVNHICSVPYFCKAII